MKGNARRVILKFGVEVEIHNSAPGSGGGGRTMPDYSEGEPDDTAKMISEQRGQGRTVTASDGTEVETSIEFRYVPERTGAEITVAGEGDPTRLLHPSGIWYRVMERFPEDAGVHVLSVVED